MAPRTPDELCATVIRMMNEDNDIERTRRLTGLSPKTITSILSIWETTGTTRSHIPRPLLITGRPCTLELGHVWYIAESLNQCPTLYLDKIQNELLEICGINVSLSTISTAIKQYGITRKKIEKHAKERSKPPRAEFLEIVHLLFTPDQLVCVDESSIDERGTVHTYGYAPSGQRDCQDAPFDRGIRYSLLPALSLAGILLLRVIEGSFTAERFKDFIAMLLTRMNPYPGPNSVIIMDNARIHRQREVLEMIEARGMRYLFLPPYSPDLNAIEFAFSKIKSGIERDGGTIQLIMSVARRIRPHGAIDYVDPDVLHKNLWAWGAPASAICWSRDLGRTPGSG